MKKNLNKYLKNLKKEFKTHPVNYIFLAFILGLGLFVRVYRAGQMLGFYYDQGRDALVIWRLWHEGKLFLVGPVTGLAGIFLGPLYYYLIAPFYLIGGGNPVVPAIFLSFLAILATFMLYFLGWKFHSRTTGLIAATIGAFSINLVHAGRWLANPTPILLTSMILLWSMWKVVLKKNKRWWIVIALLIGFSLQFEVASAVFYIPMILVFAIWQRKNLPDKRTLAIALGVFILTLLPQIAFNYRHENILFNNFKRVLFEEKSFKISFWEVLPARLNFFWDVFNSKIIPDKQMVVAGFTLLVVGILLISKKKAIKSKLLPLFSIFLGVPMLGFIAFQGNFGNIYDYYMTGYYLPMVLLFSLGLGKLWRNQFGKIVVIIFFVQFFMINGPLVRNYLTSEIDSLEFVTLESELKAVNWIFEDAKGRGRFNVDVYVPPVIPYSYDYLFLWQGTKTCGKDLCQLELEEMVPLLYTLYEEDPPHPWRLEAWLERQKGIGLVEKEEKFGMITVERRERI